jgi:hypothetical protein
VAINALATNEWRAAGVKKIQKASVSKAALPEITGRRKRAYKGLAVMQKKQ